MRLAIQVAILLRMLLLTVVNRSGYAKLIALPMLRNFYAKKNEDISTITKEEAIDVIRKCMEVLYYRVLE
jgi:20S proteasome alpha/beta subunit